MGDRRGGGAGFARDLLRGARDDPCVIHTLGSDGQAADESLLHADLTARRAGAGRGPHSECSGSMRTSASPSEATRRAAPLRGGRFDEPAIRSGPPRYNARPQWLADGEALDAAVAAASGSACRRTRTAEPTRKRELPDAMGERDGPDPSASGKVDHRLRVDDVRKATPRCPTKSRSGGSGIHVYHVAIHGPRREGTSSEANRDVASTGGDTRRPYPGDAAKQLDHCTVATSELRAYAKYRVFVWLDTRVCPDSVNVSPSPATTTRRSAYCTADSTSSGRSGSGTWLEVVLVDASAGSTDPRYTPTTTFAETFPFPPALAPDVPATDYASDPRIAIAIADAARRLVNLRDRWLNPPEWVEWVDEPVSGYPKRPVPRDEDYTAATGAQETHADEPLQRPPAVARRRTRSP